MREEREDEDESIEYGAVVVGGGMAGVFAALGASVKVQKVLLVEENASLGGQGTLTGERQFCGDVTHVNQPFEELLEDLRRHNALGPVLPTRGGTKFDGETTAFLLQEKVLGAGVDVLFHTSLIDVKSSRGRVDQLLLQNKSGLRRVRSRYVIDCTGDGDLCVMAGFPMMKGGETRTPEGGRRPGVLLQLPMSLCFWMEDVGSPVQPVLPPNCPTWQCDEDIPMTSINHISPHIAFVKMKVIGGDVTDGKSYSDAEIRARRQMMGLVYHLQTKGYRGKVYSTYRLRFVAPGLGIREGRRVVGEYVLTEEDVRRGRRFPDAVAVGTYQIDYHWPDLLPRAGTGITDTVPPYHIPMRSLIPRGSKNVLVAGRCVSGDQMAMSSFRVMTTCAQTGFAAGLACGIACEEGIELGEIDLNSLQVGLERRGQLLHTTPYRRYRRQRRFVNEAIMGNPAGECQNPTVLELNYGETIAAWLGSSGQGGGGSAIWAAKRVEGEWTEPLKIVEDVDAPLRNLILFRDGSGPIRLYYRIARADLWASKYRISEDGLHWSAEKSLRGTEDSGVGVWNRPIVLENGDWLAPSCSVFGTAWAPTVNISHNGGRTWVKGKRISLDPSWVKDPEPGRPTLWESDPDSVHMLVTDGRGSVYRSDSVDGGRSWRSLCPTNLSRTRGLDLLSLEDGKLALVRTPARRKMVGPARRSSVLVSLSDDNGRSWRHRHAVKDPLGNGSQDLSNPSAATSPEGLSVVYVLGRDRIGFCRLSVEHVKGL